MDSIPKITPNDSGNSDQVLYNANSLRNRVQERTESLLIPKINMPVSQSVEKGSTNIFSKIKRRKISGKYFKVFAIIGSVILAIILIVGFLAFNAYKDAMKVKLQAQKLKDSFAQKDLNLTDAELDNLKKSIDKFKSSYSRLSFLKVLPIAGSYYKDGQHLVNASLDGVDAGEILLDSVKPYSDILGFKGSGASALPNVKTAQDKIDFVIKTIPELVPKIDSLSEKINSMNSEVGSINPKRYPVEFRGVKVRENLERGVELLSTTNKLITEGKPLLAKSNYFLGVDSPRTYMVIFQNDKELRPTGGFITAYSIAQVNKGRFIPVSSSDIYDLDNKYKPSITAPDQFPKYLKGIYIALNKFRLRDMNWSPDFEVSMNMFSTEIKKAGVNNIDGIIAVDTQMLVNLLDVVGKISVPEYGDFSSNIVPECNCAQVVYELESFADTEGAIVWSENEPGKIVFAPPNYDDRKKIIGPLMNSILSSTLGQPDAKFPLLFETAIKSLTEKHVLFYLFDKDAQAAVKAFGIAGDVKDSQNSDYLYINDANLGGRKSNLYVTEEVNHEVVPKNGYLEETLTITYKNPEKQDGWLNSVLPNWIRIYVPKGSAVLSNEGFGEFIEPYEDLGKTVFAGFVSIRPQGVAKVSLKYKVPMNVDNDYRLFIQKQPGKDTPLYTLKYGKSSDEFLLKTDKEIRL